MKWMIPINGLSAQQRSIIGEITDVKSKTSWVAGYAGTGKTIVITHALKRLANITPRKSVCFMAYTYALKDLVESGISAVENRIIKFRTLDSFNQSQDYYDYIIVDEVQDIRETQLKRILKQCKNLIVAGDPDQSIFLGRVDPEDIDRILGEHTKHTLRDIHRLGKKLFDVVKEILPEAKIVRGAKLSNRDEHRVWKHKASTEEEEFLQIFREAHRLAQPEKPSAVLFPTHDLIYSFASEVANDHQYRQAPPPRTKRGIKTCYEDFNNFFKARKCPLMFLGSDNGSLPESDSSKIVYLMTYQSAKGLDFENVFLPSLKDGVYLDAKPKNLSREAEERRHFFVALTRSRRNVFLSYHGTPHWVLKKIPADLTEPFKPQSQRGFSR
jgi:superfamily I DNA/RNA helicase